jgi:hypothetical protein
MLAPSWRESQRVHFVGALYRVMHDSRRRFLTRSGSFSQRVYGALLLVLGLVAIIAPFNAGE